MRGETAPEDTLSIHVENFDAKLARMGLNTDQAIQAAIHIRLSVEWLWQQGARVMLPGSLRHPTDHSLGYRSDAKPNTAHSEDDVVAVSLPPETSRLLQRAAGSAAVTPEEV